MIKRYWKTIIISILMLVITGCQGKSPNLGSFSEPGEGFNSNIVKEKGSATAVIAFPSLSQILPTPFTKEAVYLPSNARITPTKKM